MHNSWRSIRVSRRWLYSSKLTYNSHLEDLSTCRIRVQSPSLRYSNCASTSNRLAHFAVSSTHPKQATSDTIFALSTAPGRAAIAVIRISGPACLSIYQQLCPNTKLPKPRTAILRKLYHPQDRRRILDSGSLILLFLSPNTVTGEDVLELHVHGGPAIVRSVLDAIPKCSRDRQEQKIRHAEPGEFTKRAFYNNRIDLTQAEALGDSLAAETEQQQRLAVSGTTSYLAQRYGEWRRRLLYARGEIEALIDFSEDQHFDEDPEHFIESVSNQVIDLKGHIDLHVQNASRGDLLREGINVALLGAPNAGKSSLLNRIVGREAAIVSAEAGTTRDIVDVNVDLAGWLVRLGDMAGLRNAIFAGESSNAQKEQIGAVETEGIRRARERASQSDLIIVLFSLQLTNEGKVELASNDELFSSINECKKMNKQLLFVINKIDLLHQQTAGSKTSLSSILSGLVEKIPDLSPNDVFCLSCKDMDRINPDEPDPGGMQTFLSGLKSKFSNMTAAISGEIMNSTMITPAEARNYWTASLSVSHRQSMYLQECLHHLNDFLIATRRLPSSFVPSTIFSHHIDGHDDLVGEINETTTTLQSERSDDSSNSSTTRTQALQTQNQISLQKTIPEIDIVTAAEHLRYAADSLARITGRGEGGDVEDVLGVVFEK